jgi:hypothetical protein
VVEEALSVTLVVVHVKKEGVAMLTSGGDDVSATLTVAVCMHPFTPVAVTV